VKFEVDGEVYLLDNEKPRATQGSGPEAGWVVDRVRFGSRSDDSTAVDASMLDRVRIKRKAGQRNDCTARTFAIDIDGGEYLGGFAWGYTLGKDGTIRVYEAKPAEMSDAQRGAIKGWNAQAALTDDKQKNSANQQVLPIAHQAYGDYNPRRRAAAAPAPRP
jgi:hypothetical protein